MSQKRSPVWLYYDVNTANKKYATCKVCKLQVSRGSENSRAQTTKMLHEHLKNAHIEEYKIVLDASNKNLVKNDAASASSSMSNGSVADASIDDGQVAGPSIDNKKLKTKAQRKELFQQTIPDWSESKTMLPLHSKKAQEFHTSVFEMLVVDNRPFSMVNDRGFLRLFQKLVPNIEVSNSLSKIFFPFLWKNLYLHLGGF